MKDRDITNATWRRILRVPWTERRTNFSVLEEVKPKISLEATIFRLELRYFGHVMRAKGSLERDIMLGQVAGYRRQENHRCAGWTVSRKLQAYDWKS
jgi:hypothetical protein